MGLAQVPIQAAHLLFQSIPLDTEIKTSSRYENEISDVCLYVYVCDYWVVFCFSFLIVILISNVTH